MREAYFVESISNGRLKFWEKTEEENLEISKGKLPDSWTYHTYCVAHAFCALSSVALVSLFGNALNGYVGLFFLLLAVGCMVHLPLSFKNIGTIRLKSGHGFEMQEEVSVTFDEFGKISKIAKKEL